MKTDLTEVLEVCSLNALSKAEVAALSRLKITSWQEIKGGSFAESLDAWNIAPKSQVLGLCFQLHDQPVGMVLFKRPPLSPPWATVNSATIHGLKISLPFQGRGLGHKAFTLAVNHLRQEWPSVTTLMLSVDADNSAALAVYRAYGMVDSGPIFKPGHGIEHRFSLAFNSPIE